MSQRKSDFLGLVEVGKIILSLFLLTLPYANLQVSHAYSGVDRNNLFRSSR